jgi:Holliday junction resolvase RusA-like endonuclease
MSEIPGSYLATPATDTTGQPSMLCRFTLDGAVVPEARPRFGNGCSYLPDGYRLWRETATWELRSQANQMGVREPIQRSSITIHLYGSHRGDLDNLAGSVLDALVLAGILQDDHLTSVYRLVVEACRGKRKTTQIEILTGEPS